MQRRIRVQKFGGTSVATSERREQVAGHVRRALDEGCAVALVVSAMGRRGDPYATDTLLDLLRGEGGLVHPADYNMAFVTGEMISVAVMSHALKRAGIPAVPLSGVQAGIYAEGHPLEAEVTTIDTRRLLGHLDRGEVPVVTGGQAAFRESLDFATLGRGASDTSGVLLGVALGAERVEIFTDVLGLAATDPRLVPGARWVRRASYARMHELARFGAKVVHPRAIEAGWRAHLPIAVRSTFSTEPGTFIGDVDDEGPVLGIATLGPMDTRAVTRGAVSGELLREWERQRLIMSLPCDAGGRLILGIQADRAHDLDAALGPLGVEPLGCWPSTAWLSLVGDPEALRRRCECDRACLATAGVDVHAAEFASGRTTFVLPAASLGAAVTALYADVFEGSGMA